MKGEMPMFQRGQTVKLKTYDVDNHPVELWNLNVIEYDNGLLKVKDGSGVTTVYNLRSPAVISVALQ